MNARTTRRFALILLVLLLAVTMVVPAYAHPPCNDADGDGSPSGREFGLYHVRMSALNGGMGLGTGGMAPGYMHTGFSICLDR
ncbi:MAG TPA: hypothetical protein VFI11_15860 [Anaerolineales bacterium]|nr:hypothetical protein [Anaerolineales bacterium]